MTDALPRDYTPGPVRVPRGPFGSVRHRRSRQQLRHLMRGEFGFSSLDQRARRLSRTIHTPVDEAEFLAIVNVGGATTLTGGDTIIVPVAEWVLNVDAKTDLGTTANDTIVIAIPDYATTFESGVRAVLGVDDAACAHWTTDTVSTPLWRGGEGSWFHLYGIRGDAAVGETVPGLIHLANPNTGSVYGGGICRAATSNTIQFAASETFNLGTFLSAGAHIGILIRTEANPQYDAPTDRQEVASWDNATKTATISGTWAVTPTADVTTYSWAVATVQVAHQGKFSATHCIFDGRALGNVGTNAVTITAETQGTYLTDCDIHCHSGNGGETKCFTSSNGYGPHQLRNCRLTNAAIPFMLFSGQMLETPPNSAPGSLLHQCYLWNDVSEAGEGGEMDGFCKALIELKGCEHLTVEYCVLRGVWPVGQAGTAINISNSGWNDSRVLGDIHIRYNIVIDAVSFIGTGFSNGDPPFYAPFVLHDLTVEHNYARVGYDPRDGSDGTNTAVQFTGCTRLTYVHNTVLGNHGSKLLTYGQFTLGKDPDEPTLPYLSIHGNVSAEHKAGGYTIAGDGAVGAGAANQAAMGAGWVFRSNCHALGKDDAASNYAPAGIGYGPNFDATHFLDAVGSTLADNQALLLAKLDANDYMTDADFTDAVDGVRDGAAMPTVLARTAGVESGTPTWRAGGAIQLSTGRLVTVAGVPQVVRE